MKKIAGKVGTAAGILAVLWCGSSWSAPLVKEKAPLSQGMDDIVEPREREIPDEGDVGIPAYPEARFCTVSKGEWGDDGWNIVTLLSTAPFEEVKAWYQKRLAPWTCQNWAGMDTWYVCSDKKDEYGGADTDPKESSVVDISAQDSSFACEMPGMKTKIELRYQPD